MWEACEKRVDANEVAPCCFQLPFRPASNFVLKRCHVGALGAWAISRAALVRQVGPDLSGIKWGYQWLSDSQEKRGNLPVRTSMAAISKMKWRIDRAPTLPGSRFAFWGSAASAALQICNCSCLQVWSLLQCAFWMYTWPPFVCGWCGVDRLPGRLAIFPLDLDRARGCSLRLGGKRHVSRAQQRNGDGSKHCEPERIRNW